MSASVFKPIRPHDNMTRMRTPPPLDAKRIGMPQDVQKVRRALFGPVNHEENRRMAQEHFAAQLTTAISRWEFDFNKGVPLNTNTSRYIWSIVAPSPKETCRLRAPTKQQSQPAEIPENNLHLYLDPLQDLTPSASSGSQTIDNTQQLADDSAESEEEQQPEKMHISPVRSSSTTKQTSITDFMTMKKSNTINTIKTKRLTEASVSRPSKLPRTSNSSAS